jgi:hypothetical protein
MKELHCECGRVVHSYDVTPGVWTCPNCGRVYLEGRRTWDGPAKIQGDRLWNGAQAHLLRIERDLRRLERLVRMLLPKGGRRARKKRTH